MPSILAPVAAYADKAHAPADDLWLFYLSSSHGVRLLTDRTMPDALVPSDPHLYDGGITFSGAQRWGFGRQLVLEVLEGVVLSWPRLRLELSPETKELVAAGAQWRVQSWSIDLAPHSYWWRDMLRRREKVLHQPGWIAHTYDTLTDATQERTLARGRLVQYDWTRERLTLSYEPL